MSDDTWTAVDDYLAGALLGRDAVLDQALDASAEAGLPAIQVSAPQGKMLELLARVAGARTVLEIGTLGGYSTIWLARALPVGGHLVSLEIDPTHAEVARRNLAAAGLAAVAEVRVGPALATLEELVAEGAGPFDVVFIDADKARLADYVLASLEISRPGTVIVVDNVVRNGQVLDAASADPDVLGVRRCIEVLGSHPRLSATAIQTVGSKGYDGFALAVVSAPPLPEP